MAAPPEAPGVRARARVRRHVHVRSARIPIGGVPEVRARRRARGVPGRTFRPNDTWWPVSRCRSRRTAGRAHSSVSGSHCRRASRPRRSRPSRAADFPAMSDEVALGARFARAVLARDLAADECREEIERRWGPRAVLALAYALSLAAPALPDTQVRALNTDGVYTQRHGRRRGRVPDAGASRWRARDGRTRRRAGRLRGPPRVSASDCLPYVRLGRRVRGRGPGRVPSAGARSIAPGSRSRVGSSPGSFRDSASTAEVRERRREGYVGMWLPEPLVAGACADVGRRFVRRAAPGPRAPVAPRARRVPAPRRVRHGLPGVAATLERPRPRAASSPRARASTCNRDGRGPRSSTTTLGRFRAGVHRRDGNRRRRRPRSAPRGRRRALHRRRWQATRGAPSDRGQGFHSRASTKASARSSARRRSLRATRKRPSTGSPVSRSTRPKERRRSPSRLRTGWSWRLTTCATPTR